DYSRPKSNQSPIHSNHPPHDPYEDVSDPSPTLTNNIKKQDEDPLSNSTVPTNQSPENILEVTTLTTLVNLEDKSIRYQLPLRHNHGKGHDPI
ncbi:unnamed protein product, partial [Prunus brigantina]